MSKRSRQRKRKKSREKDNQGWRNGGIVALDLDPTDHEDDPNRKPSPRIHGVAVFRGLEAFGAIPELAWLFSASACELGFTSSWDSLTAIAMIGGGEKAHGDASSTLGPPEHMQRAAGLQRRILGRLKQLPPRLQAIIEIAYTDRRYRNPDVNKYGPGIVAIVKRAHYAKAALARSPLGQELALLQALLMGFADIVKTLPDWSPLEAELHEAHEDLDMRELNAAQSLLTRAHEAYRRTKAPPEVRKRKRRKPSKRRPADSMFIAEASTGAGKRRLVPVPMAMACNL